MNNHLIAEQLLKQARLLDRNSNLYRIRSYRHAAMVIQRLDLPVAEILRRHGRTGLAAIPGIGDHLAFNIEVLLRTGRFIRWTERKSITGSVEKVA
jgi:DNA polymerase/3'-5' exonuclease PolX